MIKHIRVLLLIPFLFSAACSTFPVDGEKSLSAEDLTRSLNSQFIQSGSSQYIQVQECVQLKQEDFVLEQYACRIGYSYTNSPESMFKMALQNTNYKFDTVIAHYEADIGSAIAEGAIAGFGAALAAALLGGH